MHTPILSLLTTTAVVLHALLGCCGHHSHADQGLACDDAHQTVQTSCGCRHGGVTSPSTDEEPADEEPGHRGDGHDEPCNGPECQFVGVERSDDVEQALSIPVWLPLNEAQGVMTGTCTLSGTLTRDLCPHPSSAVVVRAATQVWLL